MAFIDKKHSSRIKRDDVLGIISDALSYNSSSEGIRNSIARLKDAGNAMKNGWGGILSDMVAPAVGMGDGSMTKEDRDYCWQELQRAWETVKGRQSGVKKNNYNEIKERLYPISDLATYGNPHDALKEIKAAGQAMKGMHMEEYQYKDIRHSLDAWWNKAIARIEEKKREGSAKRGKWEDDMRSKIERLSSASSKISGSIDYLKNQRDKLRDMRDNARSSDYQYKVDGWIDEVDDKIRSALSSISDIEDKISEIRRKLDK